ncbi:hypothetical protein Ssi02_49370 [Sinosporangium siamense]|uniref:Uncharacterized protein n=1 Tax=Sinosporangium siamense TaxID=1367973 RepID=A0A919RM72_9ACTN|nr:hypothetical protein Ssi02_49370 [Sinosporangium siamense]
MGKRANGEGSVFPYKDGWAGYVWVTTPDGKKTRIMGLRQDPRGDTREVAQAPRPREQGAGTDQTPHDGCIPDALAG